MSRPAIIDRSVKALIRRVPPVFFRLAGMPVDPGSIRPGDVSVSLPEFRADHVFLIGEQGDPARWAMHLEYQLRPDRRSIRGWFLKNAALSAQLDRPVILTVVYLSKGRRTTFPTAYVASAGGLTNEFRFHAIRLWEHASRIRSGELRELAPLLVLCEDKPSERTLREERELILGLAGPAEVRNDLLAVAVTLGTRHFSRDLLESLFREEMQMLKEAPFIEEWMAEREARGRVAEARQILLRQLRKRFGELPREVVARIEHASLPRCEDLAERLLDARSLEDLGLA